MISSPPSLQERARDLVAQMTLEEKAGLCSGANFWELKSLDRLDLPSIMVTDGPHGLRKQRSDSDHLGLSNSVPATCFPSLTALCSSWDTDLLGRVGEALGNECIAEGVAVLLGPGINMKRHPLCGRNFEYFSEDPLLAGTLAAAIINGVQSRGVGTCLKHFAAYNQETNRMIVDVVVDERTLREIYLRGFELAIEQSSPWSVMSSYNRINGSYASDNDWLLGQVLRDEWDYQGMVMSDWMGTNDRLRGITAGLDLEMPGSGGQNDARIVAAVGDGSLPERDVDRVAGRVVELILKARQRPAAKAPADLDAHHQLAREAATRCAVLLKNAENTLPLQPGQHIAVIGAFAREPRFQGSGSSLVNPTRVDNAWDALQGWAAEQAGTTLSYAAGYDPVHSPEDPGLIEQASAVAGTADVAVVFIGLPASYDMEISDRHDMSLPVQHNRLVDAVAATGTPVVVVLHNGAPITMDWIDRVDSALEAYLAGQASGGAVADLLVGRANPSGKLGETFPLQLADTLSDGNFPGATRRQVQYREGLYIGYRYFNTVNGDVLFPFGHGLSYTQFNYSGASLSSSTPGADPLRVRMTVANTGACAGEEIVQVYVRTLTSEAHRPAQQLAGFDKVALAAGESAELEITLDARAFAWFDTRRGDWQPNGGDYLVEIGSSSRSIHAQLPVSVSGTGDSASDTSVDHFFRALSARQQAIPDDVFAQMLGRDIPAPEPSRPFTANSTLTELEQTWLGRKVAAAFLKKMLASANVDPEDTALLEIIDEAMKNTPLRAMALASGGEFSFKTLAIMIHMLNLRPLPALKALLERDQGIRQV